MPKTCADQYTADELEGMRSFLEDACHQSLADEGLTVDDLSDEDVVIGVHNHHVGGIRTFLEYFHDAS
jgi:hypothetical protein